MEVFLFPLVNVTLFPKTTKPLNIFEPKYLAMVRQSVLMQTPIAVAFVEDAKLEQVAVVGEKISFVRPIVGFGQAQIIEERTNGTLLIFLQGQGKARLGPLKEIKQGYLVCEAEIVQENLVVETKEQDLLKDLHKILTRWIRTHIPDPVQQDVFLKNVAGPEEILGAFGSYLVRDYDLQQMVLEFDNINEKIRFLHRLVESAEVTA